MSDLLSTQTDVQSTDLSSGAENELTTNPDSLSDAFNNALGEFFEDTAAVAPDEPEDFDLDDEVSEEPEDSPSDDGSNIEESDDDADVEEDADEDTSGVVDFNEMKQFSFEIDGKTYSANDLKAALGRQAKQAEAQTEVETARSELEAERKELESYKAQVQAQHTATVGAQQSAQLENAYAQLQEQRNKALEEGDSHTVTMVGAKMDQVREKYQQVQQELNEARAKQAHEAAKALDKYGFGSLNTDTQRQKAFQEYAMSNVPQGLISIVDTNPELLALVEKARLYDKAQQEVPKTKLKGTKKTLKGGAAKATKKKAVDPMEEAFFAALGDADFRS